MLYAGCELQLLRMICSERVSLCVLADGLLDRATLFIMLAFFQPNELHRCRLADLLEELHCKNSDRVIQGEGMKVEYDMRR